MKLNLFILLILVLSVSAWTYFSDTKINHVPDDLAKVADFKFETLAGETTSLYDQEGKVVLLHFWATWCAPCVVELPQLIELAATHHDKISIIAIAVKDKPEDIKRFLKKHNLTKNFIVGLDEDKEISETIYGTVKLPETYIIDTNLQLYEKTIGSEEDWNSPNWHAKFMKLTTTSNE